MPRKKQVAVIVSSLEYITQHTRSTKSKIVSEQMQRIHPTKCAAYCWPPSVWESVSAQLRAITIIRFALASSARSCICWHRKCLFPCRLEVKTKSAPRVFSVQCVSLCVQRLRMVAVKKRSVVVKWPAFGRCWSVSWLSTIESVLFCLVLSCPDWLTVVITAEQR